MERKTFFHYKTEIDIEATTAWYAHAGEWGCDCRDCRNYLTAAKAKKLPPEMTELLDSLGIPPEKATYLSELYTDENGVHYQVSYRVVGKILAEPEEKTEEVLGRCCHESYPYGAPDFPEPHFDLEFYPVLPWFLDE